MAKKKKSNLVTTAPTRDLRKLSPSENVRAGHSPKAENYVLRGKRVTKTTATISKRQYNKRQTAEREGRAPVSLEKAARLRREGEYRYGTAASESQAEKQRDVRALKRLAKVRTVTDKRGSTYPQGLLGHYEELRRRKLSGEELGDEWFEMMDIANAIDDPELHRLTQSPTVRASHRRRAA
jgi:hypothetical protein